MKHLNTIDRCDENRFHIAKMYIYTEITKSCIDMNYYPIDLQVLSDKTELTVQQVVLAIESLEKDGLVFRDPQVLGHANNTKLYDYIAYYQNVG